MMLDQPVPRHYLITFAFALTLFGMVLGVALTPESLRAISPLLLFPAVYSWVFFCPVALPVASVFVLGLPADVMAGLPLGSMPLASLLLQWLAGRAARRITRNFITLWLHFLLHLLMVTLVLMLLLSLYQWHWMDWQPMLAQAMLTFLCYPLVQSVVVIFLKQLRMLDHG